jgi:hypothetical protein
VICRPDLEVVYQVQRLGDQCLYRSLAFSPIAVLSAHLAFATILEEVEMTALMARQGSHVVRVIIGVDTHQDQHVAVAIDEHSLG